MPTSVLTFGPRRLAEGEGQKGRTAKKRRPGYGRPERCHVLKQYPDDDGRKTMFSEPVTASIVNRSMRQQTKNLQKEHIYIYIANLCPPLPLLVAPWRMYKLLLLFAVITVLPANILPVRSGRQKWDYGREKKRTRRKKWAVKKVSGTRR